MDIIDAHTHIFPDKIAVKASGNIGAFYGIPMYTNAMVSTLLREGAAIGVSRYLVCSSAVTPDQTEHINDFISASCKAHPELIGLGALHPDYTDISGELDRITEMGLVGIKFHNDFQKFPIDDEKALPMYREIARRGLPVLFHMGDKRYDFTGPERLRNLMLKVPDLRVHAAHFGGYSQWDEVDCLPIDPERLVFDTSSSLAFMDTEKAKRLIDRFGVESFLFGTDFPMWNAKEEMERNLALGLTERENELLFAENFIRFYHC
ncbi:MAG: radical SAM protein [Ruminococcaceae bacterium]|nr:radical SAM protein [Oscillospiraceae bacterium]